MRALCVVGAGIWSGTSGGPHSCLSQRDGVVVGLGRETLSPRPGEIRLDAGGRALLPGLVDAHLHLLPWARRLHLPDLRGVRGVEELQARLTLEHRRLSGPEWLEAVGFLLDGLGSRRPHRSILDEVSRERPILVRTHDTHAAWANSAALHAAGITRDTPDPPGGRFERDSTGEPTGFLHETAARLVSSARPEPGRDRDERVLQSGFREAARLGIVGVHSFEGAYEWDLLHACRAAGGLTLRVTHMPPRHELDSHLGAGASTGDGDDWLRLGCVKLFSDGTLGLRTAKLLAPYACGGSGEWFTPPDELRELSIRAAAGGLGVAIHAIGDHAVRASLDALESARRISDHLPLRVEHVQLVDPEDCGRFAASGIVASMQPVHFVTDVDLATKEWGNRMRGAYAWNLLRSSGAKLLFGTDAHRAAGPLARPGRGRGSGPGRGRRPPGGTRHSAGVGTARGHPRPVRGHGTGGRGTARGGSRGLDPPGPEPGRALLAGGNGRRPGAGDLCGRPGGARPGSVCRSGWRIRRRGGMLGTLRAPEIPGWRATRKWAGSLPEIGHPS